MATKTKKSKWGPNPNTNCLRSRRCLKCGHHESLEIETVGVIEGTKRTSRFWTLVRDDGTEKPVTVGDTIEPIDGKIACPECDFVGTHQEFDDPNDDN